MEHLLQSLVDDPTKVFTSEIKDSSYFERLVKDLVDPIVNYSNLDEIYIDGLDASQVFGQTKLVTENAGQAIMDKLDELKGSDPEGDDSEDDSVSGSQDEDEHEQQIQNDELDELDELDEQDQQLEQSDSEGVDNGSNVDEDSEGEMKEDISDEESPESELPNDNNESNEPTVKKDAFGLNDEFFDIDAFNKQVLALENEDPEDEDEEDVNYFEEVSDDEIDFYDDFYDKPNQNQESKPQPNDSLLEYEDEVDSEQGEDVSDVESLNDEEYNAAIGEMRNDLYEEKSTFERQQENLQKEISQLEDELVAEKKWTMKGEVKSSQRPEDSLLNDQEDFDFDRVGKPVPIITEEVTETIEDLIRKRIKNDEFDDLPKRFLNQVVKPRKEKIEVSETKSSKSLAEIYEDKYQGVEDNEKEEKITQEHEEIKELFTNVNYKLDSLTSFNFIPKPHENKIIEIKSSTIDMEDAQPEFVSNENRLAPQEVFNKDEKNDNEIALKSGLSYSRDELSREEKQRLRRANKRKKAKHFKEMESNKKAKTDSVAATLSGNKNLTIIGKSGQKTDIKGNVKKQNTIKSNNLKL